ncbi:MAG: hypothetical protein FJ173_00825 [Gammaproteobacteria bacterium]|nr:hypothetical protein [Gammaproteobacteria bacterium]
MASNSAWFVLALAILVSSCSSTPKTSTPSFNTTDRFCVDAQAAIVTSEVEARNEIHTDVAAFTKSKPVARPLVTTQYVWPESAEPNAQPMMVSCKMKTADHLVSEYGAEAAGADIGCSGVNALTLQRVLDSMTPAERRRALFKRGRNVVMETDIVTAMGPIWLEPYAIARVDESGTLRLQAKAMRNDWLDPRYLTAPPQFRGTRYCHLVAPEYLRRLLLGEVKPVSAS